MSLRWVFRACFQCCTWLLPWVFCLRLLCSLSYYACPTAVPSLHCCAFPPPHTWLLLPLPFHLSKRWLSFKVWLIAHCLWEACLHHPRPHLSIFRISDTCSYNFCLIVNQALPFFKIYLFIYLFLAVLGLRCCARAFSSCGEWGLLFVLVRGLLITVASLVAEHGL